MSVTRAVEKFMANVIWGVFFGFVLLGGVYVVRMSVLEMEDSLPLRLALIGYGVFFAAFTSVIWGFCSRAIQARKVEQASKLDIQLREESFKKAEARRKSLETLTAEIDLADEWTFSDNKRSKL